MTAEDLLIEWAKMTPEEQWKFMAQAQMKPFPRP